MRRFGRSVLIGIATLCMMLQCDVTISTQAVTYNKIVEITDDEQVVDSFRGVDAIYRYNAYETELPWNCAGYVRAFYQQIYGVNVTNLFRGQIPNGNKDGQYVEFAQVASPKIGDICGEVKENSNHWTIVRKVMGDTIVVIEQNYKWVSDDKIYCQIKRKINYKEADYRFYRLASNTKDSERVTIELPAEQATEKSTETSTETSTEKSTEKSKEKPTEKSTEKSKEKTTEKSTEKSKEKTTEKSTEKSKEKPTEKSTEKSKEKSKGTTTKKTDKTTENITERILISNITEIVLYSGTRFQLDVIYKDSGTKPEQTTFSSNDASVAKVSKGGSVLAKKPGTAVITMATYDGKTSCLVKVNGMTEAETSEKEEAKDSKEKANKKKDNKKINRKITK